MSKIHFRINYQGHKRHLEKFVERYQAQIEFELRDIRISNDQKIEGQLQVSFFIEIHLSSNEGKVYEILKLANKLWSSGYLGWTINGPHDDNGLVFECVLRNEEDDQPIKSAHIEFEN